MKFKLIYRGELKVNPKHRREHIHELRIAFHHQLEKLFQMSPYNKLNTYVNHKKSNSPDIVRKIAGVDFVPFISPALNMLAELDIMLLHPELKTTARVDIDNRLKTLMDSLRRPQTIDEVPPDARNKNNRIYTLLDDDSLVTKLSVNTSHLLDSNNPNENFLFISVTPKVSEGTIENLPFVIG